MADLHQTVRVTYSKRTKPYSGKRPPSGNLFVCGDGRTVWARRFKDLVEGMVTDAGGFEAVSELKLGLIRRCAALCAECERMESELALGPTVDIDLLARTASHYRRIAETVGLDRAQKDVSPSLSDIVKQHAQKPAGPPKAPQASPVAPDFASPAQIPCAPGDDGDESDRDREAAG
jgi:hypothetical protein